ncbi:MAG: hypothetical protein MUO21_03525, partial [Nitrososphaeraceae archaeon]|nr:hypothetical protein [Nitrososphaeraceae archaeon]
MSHCYSLQLVEDHIDFHSTSSNPKAKFKLLIDPKKHIRKVYIRYKAIVENSIYFVKGKHCDVKVSKNAFEFKIPKRTVGLEVSVKVKIHDDSCIKTKDYFPNNCKPDFTLDRPETRQMILHCNQIAIDTSGLDHTKVQPDENRIFGHQLGPHRSSRAIAIVHIAMFEAVNSILGGHTSYINMPKVSNI